MRIVALATLLALSGCATGGPTSYRQAAAPAPVGPPPAYTPGFAPGTPAAPVYTPAGAGLPTPGQPGYAGDDVRRSPNRRVLPATAEPGVWGADGAPEATTDYPPATVIPRLFGVELPLPHDAEAVASRRPAWNCARSMTLATSAAELYSQVMKLPPDVRACLAGLLFQYCALMTTQDVERKPLTPTTERTKEAVAVAVQFAERVCQDRRLAAESADIYMGIVPQWHRLTRIPMEIK